MQNQNGSFSFLDVEKWRVVRHLTTPMLTPMKIKAMSIPMKGAVEDFMHDLKGKFNENGEVPMNLDVKV